MSKAIDLPVNEPLYGINFSWTENVIETAIQHQRQNANIETQTKTIKNARKQLKLPKFTIVGLNYMIYTENKPHIWDY